MPSVAEANFLANILSPRAEAGGETLSSTKTPANSQTLTLLEAAAVSSLLDKKNSKNEEKSSKEEAVVDENTTINISKGALLPAASPATPDEGSFGNDEYNLDIYVVRRGDTIPQIADMFEITADTIYSANDLTKGAKVKEGDVLIILPSSGVDYKIKKGDTLKGIANKFKVPVEDITEYNGLAGSKIAIGQEIFIPGGLLEEEVKKTVKPKTSTSGSSVASSKGQYSTSIDTTGYFTHPAPGTVRVRGIGGAHKGIDFGAPTGTPIYAAAAGRVIFSKDGWNGRYGNLIIIQHDNGTRTLYAHQSRRVAQSGERVEKGELIGYIGSTGRSTGPHLHFEVLGGRNPF